MEVKINYQKWEIFVAIRDNYLFSKLIKTNIIYMLLNINLL